MIRINRKTDYAIRVILALAKEEEQTWLSTSQIQQEMIIPKAQSLRVVAELARGDFINTFPGRDGGMRLARPAEKINLRQVVTHFEKDIIVSECVHRDGKCPFEENCPIERRWSRLRSIILSELENTTFDVLAQESIAQVNALPQVE